jgi:hypothetical protein
VDRGRGDVDAHGARQAQAQLVVVPAQVPAADRGDVARGMERPGHAHGRRAAADHAVDAIVIEPERRQRRAQGDVAAVRHVR